MPHATSRQQVAGLVAIADRDLADAARGISDDWKFGIAYNAVLNGAFTRSSVITHSRWRVWGKRSKGWMRAGL